MRPIQHIRTRQPNRRSTDPHREADHREAGHRDAGHRDAGHRDAERGAGLAEYALILFLVALVAVVTLTAMGDTINNLFSESNVQLGGTEIEGNP